MGNNSNSFFKINVPATIILTIIPVAAGYYLAAIFSLKEQNTFLTIYNRLCVVCDEPFKLYFNELTIPLILFSLIVYAFIVLIIGCMHKPTRYGEEQGSSRLESPYRVNRELADLNNNIDDEYNIVVYSKKTGFVKNIIMKWRTRKIE